MSKASSSASPFQPAWIASSRRPSRSSVSTGPQIHALAMELGAGSVGADATARAAAATAAAAAAQAATAKGLRAAVWRATLLLPPAKGCEGASSGVLWRGVRWRGLRQPHAAVAAPPARPAALPGSGGGTLALLSTTALTGEDGGDGVFAAVITSATTVTPAAARCRGPPFATTAPPAGLAGLLSGLGGLTPNRFALEPNEINRSLGLLLLLLAGQLCGGSRAPVGCGEAGAMCDMLRLEGPRTGRAAAEMGGAAAGERRLSSSAAAAGVGVDRANMSSTIRLRRCCFTCDAHKKK